MSELTKEYFDQQIGGLRSDVNTQIDGLRSKMDKRFDAVEKKIESEASDLATMVSNLEDRIDVRDQVQNLDKRMKKIESALNISA